MAPRRPLKNISDDALDCAGEVKHAMVNITGLSELSTRRHRGLTGRDVTHRCVLCGSLRHRLISRATGEVITQSYDHTPAYKDALEARRSEDGFNVDTFRLERLVRMEDAAKSGQKGNVTSIRRSRKSG